jgi:hypothetical protein
MPTGDIAASATGAQTPGVISSAKQARIDVWRNEVASALLEHTAPPPPSSRSTYSSLSSSTNRSTSSFLPSVLSGRLNKDSDPLSDPQRPPSRVRRIWSRIERHFSGRLEDIPGDYPELYGPDGVADQPRTAMYASLLPPPLDDATLPASGQQDGNGDDAPPGEPSSDGRPGGSKAIREKQERLQRAARLLQLGTDPSNQVHAS